VSEENRAEGFINQSRNKLIDVANLKIRGVFSESFHEDLTSLLVVEIDFILLFSEKMKQDLSVMRVPNSSLILLLQGGESSSGP
jgi:hypothetical protein